MASPSRNRIVARVVELQTLYQPREALRNIVSKHGISNDFPVSGLIKLDNTFRGLFYQMGCRGHRPSGPVIKNGTSYLSLIVDLILVGPRDGIKILSDRVFFFGPFDGRPEQGVSSPSLDGKLCGLGGSMPCAWPSVGDDAMCPDLEACNPTVHSRLIAATSAALFDASPASDHFNGKSHPTCAMIPTSYLIRKPKKQLSSRPPRRP
jgi:hypothetical protein